MPFFVPIGPTHRQLYRLIPIEKLGDFLIKKADGLPSKILAKQYGLTLNQVSEVVRYNREKIHSIRRSLGLPTDARTWSKNQKRLPPRKRDTIKQGKQRRCLQCREIFSTDVMYICRSCKQSADWQGCVADLSVVPHGFGMG